MMKNYRKNSMGATHNPFLIRYCTGPPDERTGLINDSYRETLNSSSFTERLPYKENIPEHFQFKHKKAILQNDSPHQYHRQETTNQGLHPRDARRNSELPRNRGLDQENRRPARRWSKHGTNYENVQWDGSLQQQNMHNMPYVSQIPSTGKFRTLNDSNYRPIRSPVRYERRQEFAPSLFEIRYDHSKSDLCNLRFSNPNYKAPAMEQDYGFSDFKIKRTPSEAEKKVTSTRRPSTASTYARNAGGTSSVTGTLSRSVARVIKRRKHVVLLGLDGSGKTTILMRLKYDAKLDTTPTVGFNHEKIRAGGFRWSAWDVGGGERVRSLWATYTRGTDGVVFVVDASASADTMEEARLELARIMKLAKAIAVEMDRTPPPLLVMANFQDRKQARSAPAIAKCLSLPVEGQAPPSGAVPVSCWAVACVCAVTGDGLDEAFATLRHLIDNGATQPAKRKKIPGEWWR